MAKLDDEDAEDRQPFLSTSTHHESAVDHDAETTIAHADHDHDSSGLAKFLAEHSIHTSHTISHTTPNLPSSPIPPLPMCLLILTTALGSLTQGFSQTSMNGANLLLPTALSLPPSSTPLILGVLNCAIYLSNALIGSVLVFPLNNAFGRRGAVFLGAVACTTGTLGGALAPSWQVLLVARVVLGAGLGVLGSTCNVWLAEGAEARRRGGLGVVWQMFCAAGIWGGCVVNWRVYDWGPTSWRYQLGAPIMSTIPLMALVFLVPESPAWHIKHNQRYDRAFTSLFKLRGSESQAIAEVYQTYLQRAEAATGPKGSPSYLLTLSELFTIPRVRRATLASYTTMLSQQLCGINVIAFYSSTIFADANFGDRGALLASVAFGFVNFIGAFPALWTMDSLGRRSLLLLTLPVMAVTMFAAGLAFTIPEDQPARFVVLASMIYLFCAEYSPGMGPVPAAYSAEVFPLGHREIGMSSAVSVTNLWAAVLSLTFPTLLDTMGSMGAFMLYAGLNVVAWLLVFLFVPETKKKTLEELDDVFSVSTRTFINYQVCEYLPWWTKRYVLRRKGAEMPVLGAGKDYQALEQTEEIQ